jgi:hypothetical protein
MTTLTKEDIKEVIECAALKGLKMYVTAGAEYEIYVIYREKKKETDWLFKGNILHAMIFLNKYIQE